MLSDVKCTLTICVHERRLSRQLVCTYVPLITITLSTLNVTDMFDHDLNPPYQIQALPVVERETVTGTHTQQVAAKYSLSSKLRFEGLFLFEILEKLDARTVLTYCIPVREGRRKKREKEGERKGGREEEERERAEEKEI